LRLERCERDLDLARQLAFKETGEVTANEIAAHLKEHQSRLIAEAEKWLVPIGIGQ